VDDVHIWSKASAPELVAQFRQVQIEAGLTWLALPADVKAQLTEEQLGWDRYIYFLPLADKIRVTEERTKYLESLISK
jgi:hypothetical protein